MLDLIVLSLPQGAVPGSVGDPETRLKNWIAENVGARYGVASYTLPDLKIGTLDNLVVQSDEAAKIDDQLQQMLLKVHETIADVFENDNDRMQAAEKVNGLSPWQFIQQFAWNSAKHRVDRPISALLANISNEAFSADSDLRARYQEFTVSRTNIATLERKQAGDLATRSLEPIVKKSDLVTDSEFLASILLVVPASSEREFLGSYETAAPMVVPRSAKRISKDATYVLYAVTVFKKYLQDFLSAARNNKWLPREIDLEDPAAGQSLVQQQREAVKKNSDILRDLEKLSSACFGDILRSIAHVKIIRMFVESVLRYGLPPTFVTAAFVPERSLARSERVLLSEFGFLGGNAVLIDKNGKIKDDVNLSGYETLIDQDYKPFVIYVLKLP